MEYFFRILPSVSKACNTRTNNNTPRGKRIFLRNSILFYGVKIEVAKL